MQNKLNSDGNVTHNMQKKNILIFANKNAGRFNRKHLNEIIKKFDSRGIDIEVCVTNSERDVTQAIIKKDILPEIIAIYGGDGTINSVIAALYQSNKFNQKIAIIPGGTVNVLVKEMSLPMHIDNIINSIITCRTVNLHYGLANNKPFILMLSLGIDSRVVYEVNKSLKSVIGRLAYFISLLKCLLISRPIDIEVYTEDKYIPCRLVIITNSSLYGGEYILTKDTNVTHSGLAILCLEKDNFISLVRIFWRLHRKKSILDICCFYKIIDQAEVKTKSSAFTQMDGDTFETTPISIRNGEGFFKLII